MEGVSNAYTFFVKNGTVYERKGFGHPSETSTYKSFLKAPLPQGTPACAFQMTSWNSNKKNSEILPLDLYSSPEMNCQ